MVQISFEAEFKNFRFFHESITGVKNPPRGQEKIQIAHFFDRFDYQTLNETEIRVKFRFRLVITPKVGESGFDGECIMESPEQKKIKHLLEDYPGDLKHAVNRFLLKECYLYTEKLANSENYFFPPVQKVLSSYGIN